MSRKKAEKKQETFASTRLPTYNIYKSSTPYSHRNQRIPNWRSRRIGRPHLNFPCRVLWRKAYMPKIAPGVPPSRAMRKNVRSRILHCSVFARCLSMPIRTKSKILAPRIQYSSGLSMVIPPCHNRFTLFIPQISGNVLPFFLHSAIICLPKLPKEGIFMKLGIVICEPDFVSPRNFM